MKELTKVQSSLLVGGNRDDRMAKQRFKCFAMGSARACRRYIRIVARR